MQQCAHQEYLGNDKDCKDIMKTIYRHMQFGEEAGKLICGMEHRRKKVISTKIVAVS